MSPHTPSFFLAGVLAHPESYCFHRATLMSLTSDMSHTDDIMDLMTIPCHLPRTCVPVQHSLQSQVCLGLGKVSVTAHDSLDL